MNITAIMPNPTPPPKPVGVKIELTIKEAVFLKHVIGKMTGRDIQRIAEEKGHNVTNLDCFVNDFWRELNTLTK